MIPQKAWTPAYDADTTPRDGAWVVELIEMVDLTGWPPGMRIIVRAERPHPGAQLRFTDIDGNRLTAFATNTTRGQLADLELRHRRRARCEDRIRAAKDPPAPKGREVPPPVCGTFRCTDSTKTKSGSP
ncbi:transposase [Nakamurella antarctica]|uniref:transposase n=1 Tax=Nakamurella antarctica TaxID=1902245 RepID=UPI0024110B12|nr:transposase [Nakamurella antarctica]